MPHLNGISDSNKPPTNNPTVDELLTTVAKEAHKEPTPLLSQARNLPTLHVLLAGSPRQLFPPPAVPKISVFPLEVSPLKQKFQSSIPKHLQGNTCMPTSNAPHRA